MWHTHYKFSTKAKRRHFVTRQDVLNLSRKDNHLSGVHHENDAQSVEQMVEGLKKESYNPSLFYKRQGSLDPAYPQLSADAFVLAFQTEFQWSLYEMFASTIICLDSTHKTNSQLQAHHSHCSRWIWRRLANIISTNNYKSQVSLTFRTASCMVHLWQGGHVRHELIPEQATAGNSWSEGNDDRWWYYKHV